MNLKTNLLALLLLIIGTVALNAQTQTPVAVYTGECGSQYYRIPAIVTANNGDLLFFNDDRKNNNSDVGCRNNTTAGIDLLVKRLSYNSTNGSYTTSFASSQNITPNKSQYYYCYGDPAVVVDRESSNVLVLTIGGVGADTNVWYKNKTSFVIKSADNGQTWSSPVQVSLPTITDNSSVTGFFFASGRILQSKVIKKQGASYYRIYSALLYTGNNNGTGPNYNKVFYSDDFGTTWNLLGGTYAQTSADEAKLEELPNGDLILTTRKGGGRYINKYTYTNTETAAGSWGKAFEQSYAFTGGCAINADMLTMTAYRTSDNRQVTLLLLSTATGSSRTNIKIFYHEIDNNTTVANLTSGWTATSFTLPNTSTFGGYSAMTLQADDKIGVYYEGNTALCPAAGNDFSNLYYIAYTLEQLTGNAYTLTDPNPPVVVVPDVEIPDGVVPIYEWQGSHSDRWSDPLNWTVINAVNNTPLARGMVPPTPDDNSNVKIEAPGDGEYNPVLDAPLTINNLYVAPGAAIGNQYWLRVKEKVYTDVEIPTNQWVRMSMPLRDTYSGDMYTTTQGGVMPDDEFTGATYNPTEGNSGNNRVFPYAIYQRVFSDAVNVMTDDQTGTELHQLNSSWSVPYNDLAAKYQVAEGFDLWAPSTEATATFRFPSATDEYAYYYSNGNASTRKESVNHAASGTMAYGNSGNGVMDVTLTRASRANDTNSNGVPMYAVGNPSFSYLDVAEFIRVNAYGASHSGNASVVGNITPYVYKYNEGQDLDGGEASETIYYLDNDDKKLHKVTAAVSNTTMPDNSTLADADGVYVAPTRGFRVMAGQAEVSAIEPKLIGQYVNASVHQAAVPFYSGTTQSGTPSYNYVNYDAGTWVTRSTSAAGNGNATFNMAISVGSSPDKVLLENFAGLAVCEGIVDPISQTITIPGGSIVAFYNDGNWSGITALTNAKILGCIDKNLTYDYNTVNGHSIGYANNVSEDVDVVINYSIELNSTTNINEVHLDLQNAFAIYADMSSDYASLYSKQDRTNRGVVSSVGDNRYYNAFDCFTSMTASLELETSDNAYICPEMFGTYKYKISDASQATGMPGSPATDAEVQFQVLPIEGNYNVVRIHNLYPVPSNDTHGADIIGNVEKINDNQYRLSIPGAQSVYHGGDISSNMWVAYGWNGTSRTDLTWIFDKSATPNYFTLSGSTNLQISQLSSNPNISLSSPGFRGTTVSFTATTPGTTTTYEPHTAVVTQTRTSSGSWFTTTYTYTNTFTFDGESISYTTTTSNQTSNSGVEFGTTALENLENWLNANGYSVGGTSTLDNWSNNLNTTKSVRTREIRWEGGTVTTGATSTTITGFPQTAPYTGSTSGGSTTTGDFTVGSNYEAINLKFTPAMFEANPGNTPSASSAPRKTAAQGSTMASVKLVDGDRAANTLITSRDNAKNGFNAFEDASVIDLDNTTKLLATLAGNQVVAVNTLGDTTAVQLYLRNLNGNFTLTFDNLEVLGSNARLVDNETGMQTPLNGRHQDLTLSMTVNDSPLRYSIIWDVVSGTEEVELPLTDGDLWFKAFSTAKGTIKVTSSENMASVRLFDSTGKLVGSKVNAQNETMFEYLLSGIYVVEVSNGSETQSMKVNVK
ncbi:MAG: T9SS type A sorting domain-containing protein [Paludibacteraceae bacterium]|nr:T9SS type A sorting domain-containing protein [Paludibacteraceae bacterium]